VWNVVSSGNNEEGGNGSAMVEEKIVNSANMTIMAHQKYINAVRIAPNDKLIATSSQDKSINIW